MSELRDVFLSGEPFELEVTIRVAYGEAEAKLLKAAVQAGHGLYELLELYIAPLATTRKRATRNGKVIHEDESPGIWGL